MGERGQELSHRRQLFLPDQLMLLRPDRAQIFFQHLLAWRRNVVARSSISSPV